jgi:DNA-binding response OmpR family regulator
MSKKILIIDDDSSAEALARMVLAAEGYDISSEDDAPNGIKKAEELVPDLAIVDLMLPSGHGFAVCEKLRAMEALSGLRILVCSAKAYSQDIDGAKDAGADDYLVKPYKNEELVEKVKKLLSTA